ncbi:cystathionine gamma-lyase [Allokutzneria sp. NRRL B-24872]|uniref:cystathionine gamma-lyase n=1 Tax=Allokutzneria sp. NRRL B-24872 TaxID=1137961 RepID=UPI000A3D4FBF|nr:cystathionine gamma-lyase [Allokutzneria sp. NRRL B-24872]
MTQGWGDGTRCVHSGQSEPVVGEPFLAGPVFATAYHLDGAPGRAQPDYYARSGNPTWRALEAAIGELDGGECVLFPSGMAAISTLLRAFVSSGDTVVVPSDGYFATRTFIAEEMDVSVRHVPTPGPWPDFTGVRLVLLETPSNPWLDVCDIKSLVDSAHAAGALVAVDNTTATPLGQQPLALGADFVVASDSKALTGHSDVLLGHVSTVDPVLAERLRKARMLGGAVPAPFETWLAHRSLGTLDLRLARQSATAAVLAATLCAHPAVRTVRWPGLPEDPAHEIARSQMRRFPGVVTIELADAVVADRFLAAARLVTAATSFGGLHTTGDRRAQWGDPVPEGLVRLSVGVEDTDDLLADVIQALNAVTT